MMRTGAIIENNPIGTMPADASFEKLRLMRASAVGLLWTGGTHHTRAVYERLDQGLDRPEYIVRVGGHVQIAEEWLQDARDALVEVPDIVLAEGRIVLACGNEPNLEGWADKPEAYGQLYRAVANSSVPVLFACPSLGVEEWWGWFRHALAAVGGTPPYGIVNLYDANVERIGDFAEQFNALYVGEVNSSPWVRGAERVAFLAEAFARLARAKVRSALVFIGGGESHGAWDEGYVLSHDEAEGIGNIEGEIIVDEETTAKLNMLLAQNALITEGFRQILQGRFTGADGLAGTVVALQGGAPLDFEPSFPKA